MTLHLGYVPASSTIYIPFHTFDSNGASITLTGLAVTDIEIYKAGSVTQRSSDAGYVLLDTDGIDFDGITGLHGFSIDLSDNTDAGFYAAGSFYMVAVSAVTVDTRTVNFWAATFFIGPVAANVTQWLGTAAATPTVAGVPEVDVTHLNGVTQSLLDLKDFADDGYDPATNKVQGVVLTDTLTTYTGNTPQTGDSFARLGAPAGASVSADIAAIEAQTDDIGVAGAGLTAIPAIDANLISIDGDLTTGNNATLFLKQLNIQNNAGDAIAAHSIGGNGRGINASGNGTGQGAIFTGGATGAGAKATGGGTSGAGLELVGTGGALDLAADNIPTLAQVNAEVVDALNVDTYVETSGVPAATATLQAKISRMYDALVNKLTTTATKKQFSNNAGTAQWEKDLSDDGTVYTETTGNAP